jgi:hypothetical protein
VLKEGLRGALNTPKPRSIETEEPYGPPYSKASGRTSWSSTINS